MLDKTFFTEQIKGFLDYLNRCYPDKDIKLTVPDRDMYYNKFSYMENTKFAKIVKWLYETWNFGHFPLIADFIQAKNKLFAGDMPEYKPEPRTDNVMAVTKQKEYQRIIETIKMLSYLEDQCKQKELEWIPFVKDMLRKNMVYLKKEKKWISAGKVDINDNVLEPRKYYPPEYYK